MSGIYNQLSKRSYIICRWTFGTARGLWEPLVSSYLNLSSHLCIEFVDRQWHHNAASPQTSKTGPWIPRRRIFGSTECRRGRYHRSRTSVSFVYFTRLRLNFNNLSQSFHPYLLQTLSKWSSKIQAVAPSVLLPSNRGAFLKGGQNTKSVVELIDENLADHDKLLSRTQVARVKKPRIGVASAEGDKEDEDTVDCEIFDDTDFYQKLLRDIIESRSNGEKNEDWMVLQKQKKAKKKVDTKASKGRKIRFAPVLSSFPVILSCWFSMIVMMSTKNSRASWSLYPLSIRVCGMKSRLMSCLPLCLGKDSNIQGSIRRRNQRKKISNSPDSEYLDRDF